MMCNSLSQSNIVVSKLTALSFQTDYFTRIKFRARIPFLENS